MKNSTENNSKQLFETILQLGLVFLILGFCFKLLSPFMMPILWAAILAVILFPIFDFLQRILKGRKTLASILITITMLAFIIIPTVYFFNSVATSILEIKDSIENGTLKVNAPAQKIKDWPLIGKPLFEFLHTFSEDLEQGLLKYQSQITEVSKSLLDGIISSSLTFLQVILSVIIAGVLLISNSAKELAANFIRRVSGNKGEEILNITVSTIHQVVKGILGVAIIQTLFQAIGLYLAGIPFAGILTLLCLIFSIIQIGPLLVNIGVFIYLFSTGDTTYAVFWTVFFILSGLSDNILKPLLLGKGAMVPILVIFLGVLGGFMMSGFIGLFVGPIIFSIGYKLFVAWMDDKPANVTV
jgi:predicted PurR-regulated permease PerM